jgi:hypothetical protein
VSEKSCVFPDAESLASHPHEIALAVGDELASVSEKRNSLGLDGDEHDFILGDSGVS